MDPRGLYDIILLMQHLRSSCQNCLRVEPRSSDCNIIAKLKLICPEVLLNGSRGSLPKCV